MRDGTVRARVRCARTAGLLKLRTALAVFLACWSSVTLAASPADTEKARVAVAEGRKHYNLGEFQAALGSYREAYRLTEDPALLFNLGQCQWKLGEDRAALHSYKSYLRNGVDVGNRAQVEERIAELESRIKAAEKADAERSRAAANAPAAASETDASQKAVLEKAASAAEKAAEAAQQTAVAAEKAAEAASMRPAAAPVPAPVVLISAPPQDRGEEGPRPFYSRWWFWTAVGVVAVGAVATAVVLAYGDRGERGDCHGVTPCLVLKGN